MFSTKSRYALRILIDIAQQGSDDYIPLKDIADRQDISMWTEFYELEKEFFFNKKLSDLL